jgi:hypothetical protein
MLSQGNGGFVFPAVAAGTYTLECSAAGSKGSELLVVASGPADTVQPMLLLPPVGLSGLTVIVSWEEYGDITGTGIDLHATFNTGTAGCAFTVFSLDTCTCVC